MRKAFIAAPLIGTLIFLTAIVFTVNINKAETAHVQEITSDAYHNRVVSLLELYRADLGSLFRESMSRLIEEVLVSPGWSLFYIPFSTGGNPSLPEPQRTQRNRFESCTQVAEVINAMICADTQNSKGTACPSFSSQSQCEATDSGCKWDGTITDPDLNDAVYPQCTPDEASSVHYGLQGWLTSLQKEGYYEGVRFFPANGSKFEQFIKPMDSAGNILHNVYTENCKTLLPGNLFDCVNFAKNNAAPLRCCAEYKINDGSGTTTRLDNTNTRDLWPSFTDANDFDKFECIEPVAGCEDGVFLVQIIINHYRVFPSLPRLQADDSSGNVIRSGAIADADFRLPIKYPVYKYMDASFRLYDRLAYGNVGTVYQDGKQDIEWTPNPGDGATVPGIVSGYCIGGPQCVNSPGFAPTKSALLGGNNGFTDAVGASVFMPNPGVPLADDVKAFKENHMGGLVGGTDSLLDIGLKAVWKKYPELQFNFTELMNDPDKQVTCSSSTSGTCTDFPLLTQDFARALETISACDPAETTSECYYFNQIHRGSFIIDETPAYRVKQETSNVYNWRLDFVANGLAP